MESLGIYFLMMFLTAVGLAVVYKLTNPFDSEDIMNYIFIVIVSWFWPITLFVLVSAGLLFVFVMIIKNIAEILTSGVKR